MAEKKKSAGGSHAKPVEAEKKKSIFSPKPKKEKPKAEKDIDSFAQELYEPAVSPEDVPESVPQPEGELPVSEAPAEAVPVEDTPAGDESAPLTRAEKRAAEREEKAAAREAKKAEREAKKADDSPEAREKRRKGKIALIVACVIAALVLAGATYGGYAVTESKLTLPNVYVGDIFVGSMSEEQVRAALEENGWDKIASAKLTVKLPAKISFTLKRDDSGAAMTTEQALAAAARFAHDGNWFENLFRYVYNFFSAQDLVAYYRMVDAGYIRAAVEKGLGDFAEATAESGYVIEEEKSMMYMIKGGGELSFDEDALCALVTEALIAGRSELEYSAFTKEPAMPDFNAIHKELEREPVDAHFTETFEVVEDVVGCKFDIAQAESIWKAAAYGDSLEIPMDITFPEVTGEALSAMLYRDVLGEQVTYYPNSSDNRINNLNLAVKKISGKILLPGEIFSYNETVGQRTEEAGFLPAGAYDDGEVVEQLGGGVCQVSSTIYSATLYAQMETVDRTCHFNRLL